MVSQKMLQWLHPCMLTTTRKLSLHVQCKLPLCETQTQNVFSISFTICYKLFVVIYSFYGCHGMKMLPRAMLDKMGIFLISPATEIYGVFHCQSLESGECCDIMDRTLVLAYQKPQRIWLSDNPSPQIVESRSGQSLTI